MKTVLLGIHILVTLGLISLVLLQTSKGGLGRAFGGGEFYRSRRGAERLVFTATMILGAAFLITSILNLVVH